MRARVTVEGIAEAAGELSAQGARARRPEPALRATATRTDLEQAAARRFRRGLRRDAPATIERKRRDGYGARTMVRTGAAEAAVTQGAGPLARAVTFEVSAATVTWGVRGRSDLFYLRVLAKGFVARSGRRVPPRRVIVVDRQVREGVAARVLRFVTDGDV